MALTVTPVPRNLATKVTFLYLEFEDLFVILGLAGMGRAVLEIYEPCFSRKALRDGYRDMLVLTVATVSSGINWAAGVRT